MKNSDTSVAMGADKARNVVASGAEVLVCVENFANTVAEL